MVQDLNDHKTGMKNECCFTGCDHLGAVFFNRWRLTIVDGVIITRLQITQYKTAPPIGIKTNLVLFMNS